MTLLIVGIIVFLGIHALPMNPGLRAALVGRWGETGYKVLFSLLSIAGFVLLVYGFAHAPFVPVWSPPSWTRLVAIVLMLPASIFLVAAYVPGQIKARLKHPFLVAIKSWALAHLIANGDLASIVLFGSFLAYAVYDRITLKRRTDGGGPPIPVGGVTNDLIAVVVGIVAYLALAFAFHPVVIGVPVMGS